MYLDVGLYCARHLMSLLNQKFIFFTPKNFAVIFSLRIIIVLFESYFCSLYCFLEFFLSCVLCLSFLFFIVYLIFRSLKFRKLENIITIILVFTTDLTFFIFLLNEVGYDRWNWNPLSASFHSDLCFYSLSQRNIVMHVVIFQFVFNF